jgi:hypothetical protein
VKLIVGSMISSSSFHGDRARPLEFSVDAEGNHRNAYILHSLTDRLVDFELGSVRLGLQHRDNPN